MNWLPISKAVNAVCREIKTKPVHQRTAIRWMRNGKTVNGRIIKLVGRRFNGVYQTTVPNVRQFFYEVDNASKSASERAEERKRQRRKSQLDNVSRQLDEMLRGSAS